MTEAPIYGAPEPPGTLLAMGVLHPRVLTRRTEEIIRDIILEGPAPMTMFQIYRALVAKGVMKHEPETAMFREHPTIKAIAGACQYLHFSGQLAALDNMLNERVEAAVSTNGRRPWTEEEDNNLRLAWKLKISGRGIAEQLKRPVDAIWSRADYLGLPRRKRRKGKAKKPVVKPYGTEETRNAESQAALGRLGAIPATPEFDEPKKRRCQSCHEFFDCPRIEDILCAECDVKRFEANP